MRSLTVTLPDELVDAIEARVASGQYESESDVVRDGLEDFLADDPELDDWLRNVVVPSCERTRADPSLTTPIEGVMDRIERRYADER